MPTDSFRTKQAATLLTVYIVAGVMAAPLAGQKPSFRSAVELVLLSVTVTGADGRYVGDLAAEDFQIFEDGRQQELSFFSPASAPMSVSLVLDTSSSMDTQMPLAKQAALDFISQLRPGDVAQVVSFDSRVEVLQPLTTDRALLAAAIQRLRAGGATSLYNAVYIVLNQLAKLRPDATDEIRRDVIVVLSDGEDTSSLVSFEQVLDSAKRSQTVIYSIGLGLDETAPPTKRSDGEFALRQLTRDTGGRLFLPKRPADLQGVYGQIASELTSQYVLGFLSTGKGQGWKRLSVRVLRPNLQARTRAGYYADEH